jgi:uncharacterized protein GlcG (DUF336 family)
VSTLRTRRMLEADGVHVVLDAAEAHASKHGYRVVMTVVDASGAVLGVRRTLGAQAASGQVSIDKARTAAIFVRPSRDIEAQVSGGRLGALALHGARALTGGVPLVVDGEVVGAIGTSGETPDEDESVSLAAAAAPFPTVVVPALTYDIARRVALTVATEATARGVAPVAAVVDAGGELVYIWRPDAAQVASVGVATDKARTAAIYRRPSKDFEEQASNGRPSALHLASAVPLQGGMPLVHDGFVIGAIGVSGASSADEDQELSVLGTTALDEPTDALAFKADQVRAKFDVGGLLLDSHPYAVDAGRRDAPGDVECHPNVTDVMYAVEGAATVVTGDDHKHELTPGDVLVIPAGVPHQFTEVSNPFLYLVTKVEG